jgi:hypothetical protein
MAFADDVIIFITRPSYFQVLQQAIATFEKATDAKINPKKSTALPVGRWTHPPLPLGIALQSHVRILGVNFMASTRQVATDNSNKVVNAVRVQATKTYHRCLDITQRITFTQMYLLAKIWYILQVFPITRLHAQRITTICTWYLWHGTVFSLPVTTLQLPKHVGGWDLPNVECKCLTVLYNRIHKYETTRLP